MPGSTIIDMPFVYRVDYLPYRAQKQTSWMLLRDDVPVAIKSYTDAEAPVVIEMTRHDLYARSGKALYRAGPPVTQHRMVEGVLFERLGYAGFDEVSLDAFKARMEHAAGGGAMRNSLWPDSQFPELERNDETGAHFTYERHFDGQPPRQIKKSTRDDKRALAVERYGNEFAVIEGAIWVHRKNAEPHYAVTQAAGRTVTLTLQTSSEAHSEISTFRLDRLEDAMRFAVRRAEALDFELVQQLPDVMVYDDEAIQRDDLVQVGREILKAAQRHYPYGINPNGDPHAVEMVGMLKRIDDLTREEAARAIHLALVVTADWDKDGWYSMALDRWRSVEEPMHYVLDEHISALADDLSALKL